MLQMRRKGKRSQSCRSCLNGCWFVCDGQRQKPDPCLRKGNTRGGAVIVDGGDGTLALGESISGFSLGAGTDTSSGSMPVVTSTAEKSGVSGYLSLSMGTATTDGAGGTFQCHSW